jgi:hypothetical protein
LSAVPIASLLLQSSFLYGVFFTEKDTSPGCNLYSDLRALGY